jgi:hypothetical protein
MVITHIPGIATNKKLVPVQRDELNNVLCSTSYNSTPGTGEIAEDVIII